ncbi:MAG: pirin family protein [Bacteriovoracia bacterium]
MIEIRRSDERGRFDHGWLKSYHTFSFADYFDRSWMHFRHLRVINEDFVEPGQGFPTHPHQDMEIITYILDGALAHKDSMGNGSTILPGEIQYMSAGSGVTHSEFNPSPTEGVHLLQIWIFPWEKGLTPRYDQRKFEVGPQFKCLVSPDNSDRRPDSVPIRQDAYIYAARLKQGEKVTQKLDGKRFAWLQVARGEITLNGKRLEAGDAAGLTAELSVDVQGVSDHSEVVLFDLN